MRRLLGGLYMLLLMALRPVIDWLRPGNKDGLQ